MAKNCSLVCSSKIIDINKEGRRKSHVENTINFTNSYCGAQEVVALARFYIGAQGPSRGGV